MSGNRQAAEAVASAAMTHAASIGVALVVEWDDDRARLTFHVDRGDAPKGSGGIAIRRLIDLADAADVDITLDVVNSEPALVRHYWNFGFRLVSDDPVPEIDELRILEAERSAFLAEPGNEPVDLGVTFMWRGRGGGPLPRPDMQQPA